FLGKSTTHTPSDLSLRLLQEAHVAVVPGEAFGTERHLRISYATSQEQLEKGIQRLADFLTSL
ncbi:MAG: pyridoxal phosphate-dependent aminotransferase, partial [Acidobacteria bacterium]